MSVTDEAVMKYILASLAGRGKVDWDDFGIEIERDYRKVNQPLEPRQYERCYSALVKDREIQERQVDSATLMIWVNPKSAPEPVGSTLF